MTSTEIPLDVIILTKDNKSILANSNKLKQSSYFESALSGRFRTVKDEFDRTVIEVQESHDVMSLIVDYLMENKLPIDLNNRLNLASYVSIYDIKSYELHVIKDYANFITNFFPCPQQLRDQINFTIELYSSDDELTKRLILAFWKAFIIDYLFAGNIFLDLTYKLLPFPGEWIKKISDINFYLTLCLILHPDRKNEEIESLIQQHFTSQYYIFYSTMDMEATLYENLLKYIETRWQGDINRIETWLVNNLGGYNPESKFHDLTYHIWKIIMNGRAGKIKSIEFYRRLSNDPNVRIIVQNLY